MSIELGKKIRALRLQKGMTQEELAAKLNMSSQAVSKWENNITLPDIQLLPDLSVILGVTIDELFDLTDDTHLERIGNMIGTKRFISAEDFSYAEQFLLEKLKDNSKKSRCLTLLAQLYVHRSGEYRELAARYAKEALLAAPDSKSNHNALRDAENGVMFDWNFSNSHKLIAYYQKFVQEHPDYWQAYVWLLNYLLADGRCAEARAVLEQLNQLHPGHLYQKYGGMICKEEGNLPEALALWEQMTGLYPEDWMAWSSRGDCMAKLSRYDEAVTYYAASHELQPSPKYMDSFIAIAQIYRIQGHYGKAIGKLQEIIGLLRSEWNITEGETVDFYYREIAGLTGRLS
ncbi:helix-turn-helix domain-containing protein [Paenibacillus sp. MMS20-IR301]|uniref:helix-turn-helix domain-containing protein n=1 Tax=Paenibacillus sp. MMS20-IR301 TaxID=2895946 RepID=UPI0028EE3A53|nr:helix-turn-helix domain-containing protein [Paenibacillus sp. MMS20-IR301]WNS41933.1 helix-turn-helix domain-containing protein [Paenibacillus sp. MMS20-IR301]